MSQFGKNVNYSMDNLNQSRGGSCTLGCSLGCTRSAISLCKCRNGEVENKGSTYYSNLNSYIATIRSPTSA